jgi:hypothetical protein
VVPAYGRDPDGIHDRLDDIAIQSAYAQGPRCSMEYLILSGGSMGSDLFAWIQGNWMIAAGIGLGLFGLLWVIFKK